MVGTVRHAREFHLTKRSFAFQISMRALGWVLSGMPALPEPFPSFFRCGACTRSRKGHLSVTSVPRVDGSMRS